MVSKDFFLAVKPFSYFVCRREASLGLVQRKTVTLTRWGPQV